jgi:hypothetical protein
MEITPAQAHMHLDVLVRAGILPTMTWGEPGAQGAGITGMQGMGVSTPIAAAVAEATAGLARDEHTPNGGMFTIGLLSMIFAAGALHMVLLAGSTLSVLGAAPNEHIIIAPETTS